jgi:hypothetical protein
MPHFSAVEGVKISLFVLAVLGTLRIVTMSHPNNAVSQAFLNLY